MIASYGHKQFNVTDKQIKTFYGFSFEAKLLTEKQDSSSGKPLTIVKGEDLSNFKLSIPLSVDFGLSPVSEFDDWNDILAKGTPYNLILGTRQFGKNKYLLNSLSMQDASFSGNGLLISCTLELSFEEFIAKGTVKSTGSSVVSNSVSPGIKNMAIDSYNVGVYTTTEKASMKRQQLKWGEIV